MCQIIKIVEENWKHLRNNQAFKSMRSQQVEYHIEAMHSCEMEKHQIYTRLWDFLFCLESIFSDCNVNTSRL